MVAHFLGAGGQDAVVKVDENVGEGHECENGDGGLGLFWFLFILTHFSLLILLKK